MSGGWPILLLGALVVVAIVLLVVWGGTRLKKKTLVRAVVSEGEPSCSSKNGFLRRLTKGSWTRRSA